MPFARGSCSDPEEWTLSWDHVHDRCTEIWSRVTLEAGVTHARLSKTGLEAGRLHLRLPKIFIFCIRPPVFSFVRRLTNSKQML